MGQVRSAAVRYRTRVHTHAYSCACIGQNYEKCIALRLLLFFERTRCVLSHFHLFTSKLLFSCGQIFSHLPRTYFPCFNGVCHVTSRE